MRRRLPILAAAVLGWALACAQQGPPPGGPVDNTPPEVVLAFPAPDSAGVRPPYVISLAFSEKMDKRSVTRNLRIHPNPEWIRTEWEGTTLLVRTDHGDGERPDRGETVTVTVSDLAMDRRDNRMDRPFSFSFTSADSMPDGEVTGRVEGIRRGREVPPVILRAVRIAPADTLPPETLLETEAAKDGAFRIRPLPTVPDAPFRIVAWIDDDENRLVDRDREDYAFSDTLAFHAGETRIDSVHLALVNAETPAKLTGRITLEVSMDSVVVAAAPRADSAETVYAEPDSAGAFSFAKLPPGEYDLRILRGTRRMTALSGPETAAEALAERFLRLEPGEERASFLLPEPEREPQVTQ